jgi:hypothetical protein
MGDSLAHPGDLTDALSTAAADGGRREQDAAADPWA